ncbi:MAG TPA: hypothetical protein PKA00_09215 [Saprospiraceae bacterium]|nr:hypothetical protein [Saprospiraceae bacterium]HMQ83076.1 hypothetical protein [Saprospiraceae bacterium]
MDVLFLAYANDHLSPLAALQEENDNVYKTLTPRALQQHFIIHRDAYATREKIREFLILYRDHIFLFAYSGHAGKDMLLVTDGEARSEGLAELLGQCPNLKAVLLNGCSTLGQVEQLLQQQIPLVIATAAPVNDEKAKLFAIAFFQSLSQGENMGQAFEAGIGAVRLSHPLEGVDRGPVLRSSQANDAPNWGIYYPSEASLKVQLPQKASFAIPKDYQPNKLLLDTLIQTLKEHSFELQLLLMEERKGKSISLARKRMAILNGLPAPIAEHLRKLISPINEENEGFDKISEARLRQLCRTYQITIELLVYTMLAQMWEILVESPNEKIADELAATILAFLQRSERDLIHYDYTRLIRCIRQVFDLSGKGIPYFVPEMGILKELPYTDSAFMSANFFLHTAQQRLQMEGILDEEIPQLCIRAEESLSTVLSHLGFIANYTLASINNIDIQKFKHLKSPAFKHRIVKLIDLLGGLDQTDMVLERFTDNRSILLIRDAENKEKLSELNLSPFIIDRNAFEEDANSNEVSNIYFFSHYDAEKACYYYYRTYKPDEPLLEVSDHHLSIVKDQLDAFYELLAAHQTTLASE